MEEIKLSSRYAMVWSANRAYALKSSLWKDKTLLNIPPNCVSVWDVRTGAFVRIIHPHENRKNASASVDDECRVMNCNIVDEHILCMSVQYSINWVGRQLEIPTTLLIDVESGRIERTMRAEVSAVFQHSSRTYFALHPTHGTLAGATVRLDDPYNAIQVWVSDDAGFYPISGELFVAQHRDFQFPRFDRGCISLWRKSENVFIALQTERSIIQIYFWHVDDVAKGHQTSILKLCEWNSHALLEKAMLPDVLKVVRTTDNGVQPSVNGVHSCVIRGFNASDTENR